MFNSKPWFQQIFRPAANTLAHLGISANQVTLCTITLSLAVGAYACILPTEPITFAAIIAVMLVRLAFNHIDGLLAREHHMATPLGGILNEFADIISDIALFLPLALVPGLSQWLVYLVVLGGVVTETAGIVAVTIGARRREDGPMSKKPRGLVFAVILLVLATGGAAQDWMNDLLAGVLPLIVLTIVLRIHGAVREAHSAC